MDQTLSTWIAAGVPTLAVIVAIVRNESALVALGSRITSIEVRITSLESSLNARITSLENRLDARISNLESSLDARISNLESRLDARLDSLDRDLREWAKITMTHNTDIARLKDKTGLTG